jgi:ubiquinone/menaquinone biosynthesis C-methylase UbiE
MEQKYFQPVAAAFIRGKLRHSPERLTHSALFEKDLAALTDEELQALVDLGQSYDLPLHRFKIKMDTALPRVSRVLGMLRGLQPEQLLDIGSGRGVFVWPLLHAFPTLPITCVDILDFRVTDILAAHNGGLRELHAQQASVLSLPFADRSFDVVTMLEVLEHIPDTAKALAEVCRVARRFLILSMPSKEDNNPEHIHLFTQDMLKQHFHALQVTRVSFAYVLNHMTVIARMEDR